MSAPLSWALVGGLLVAVALAAIARAQPAPKPCARCGDNCGGRCGPCDECKQWAAGRVSVTSVDVFASHVRLLCPLCAIRWARTRQEFWRIVNQKETA